ncbi:undecaprenyldiphospho-muramoylpentapeptide beta-N-acetylglucosaminyltransferase [Oscillospiraceae bacterium MB08-C2-2]|nr:undecaprenyldiphospho-muramoylpentapeptide beta-N-acetylglucosaminyltransferase [Oscillospiraceae bacterium MB08-C2-2]
MSVKILFACGGTAGHINPAIAVASHIRRKQPGASILFAGNPNGMEANLVPKAGFDFVPIEIQGFRRQINAENIRHNVKSACLLLTSGAKARKILADFAPNVVMGTGGYVSGPVLRTASQMGIKTLTHEQNAYPGVTTKLLTRYVDTVLLAVGKAKEHLPEGKNYVVTGNPIREEILLADRAKTRSEMKIGDRLCILSFGGSLGAQRINEAIADVTAWHWKTGRVHHIHATGQYGTELFPALLRERKVGFEGNPHLDIREYIDNMPDCLAAADLVICRAGAISISELEAAGKASILIPSPNVAENHQYHNAMVLGSQNAAVVLEEKDLTGQVLCGIVQELEHDRQELENLGKNASRLAIVDACDRIWAEIKALVE